MATGDRLAYFDDLNARFPATNFAVPDQLANGDTVVAMAEGASVRFKGIMPPHYDGGGARIILHVSAAAATAGKFKLDTKFQRLSAGGKSSHDDDFAAAVEGDDVDVPATAGLIAVTENVHADGAELDNIDAGDLFVLDVLRAVVSVDPAAGNLELHAIEIVEA